MSGRASMGYPNCQALASDIAFVAHLMLRYGDWLAPILDALEDEMEAMQRDRAPQDRARLALERYAIPVATVKAIR